MIYTYFMNANASPHAAKGVITDAMQNQCRVEK